MINFNDFNYMRYPFFWNEKGISILKEQLKYIHWIFAKQQYNPETKERKKVYYANIPIAFDIEDSSFYNEDKEKVSIMYVWQVGINGIVYIGRTWEQFCELIDILNNAAENVSRETSDEYRYLIYVHFLDHEFQFIRKRFKWSSVFSRKERSPIYAITGHIEFRDSYILTGKSLASTAQDIHTYPGMKKKVGDLDYRLIRGSRTHLTRKEIGYCMTDVQILNIIIMEKIQDEHDNIAHIPLTNTGYVRRYCRQACYSKKKEHKHASYVYYKGIHDLTLQPDEYRLLKWCFQGGFTHGNPLYIGDHVQGEIGSIDFTSSYPAVILSNPFPGSSGVHVKCHSQQEFDKYIKDFLCIFVIRFKNIRLKEDAPDSIISYSKCRMKDTINPVINNGRVDSAEELVTCITSTDFILYRKFYTWDCFYIGDMYIYKKAFLPKAIIQCVLDFYKAKTSLKGVEGQELEYMLKKDMLNSVYGMMVTNIIKPEVLCSESGEWTGEEIKDIDTEIEKYNNDKKRFLFYPWGVWVTAYARRNLLEGVLEFGQHDYLYSDTDSIKCLNIDKHMDYINRYNDNIQKRIAYVLKLYGIDESEAAPENIKGVKKQIGVWDIETQDHPYTDFKCLGAKRYIYKQDEKIHTTIAGVSKYLGKEYIRKQINPFDFFSDNMSIPELDSGKLTHTYIDDRRTGSVTDYQGNKCFYDELSAVHLEPAPYHLSLLDEFKLYVEGYKLRKEVHL